MQVISTNCMITLRSLSPSLLATRCSSGFSWSKTATPPPTAIATAMAFSTVTRAPTPQINSMAALVVLPMSGSVWRSRIKWAKVTKAITPSSPPSTIHPPNWRAKIAATVPRTVISGKVRIPAVRRLRPPIRWDIFVPHRWEGSGHILDNLIQLRPNRQTPINTMICATGPELS
jgi:hypothetical protein